MSWNALVVQSGRTYVLERLVVQSGRTYVLERLIVQIGEDFSPVNALTIQIR